MAFPCGAPCEAGTAGPAPHRVVPGSQPTQCNTLGLARGSGPFEPPTGESSPLAPPSPPPLPSPSPMTEASMAPEATATRVCGASRPRARRGIASTGSRCAVAPWRSSRRRGQSVAAVRWCFRALGQAVREHGAVGTAPGVERRGGAARLPVELSGLGGRGNGSSPRGGGGCPGAQGPQPDRGSLPALGPVRASPPAHG